MSGKTRATPAKRSRNRYGSVFIPGSLLQYLAAPRAFCQSFFVDENEGRAFRQSTPARIRPCLSNRSSLSFIANDRQFRRPGFCIVEGLVAVVLVFRARMGPG